MSRGDGQQTLARMLQAGYTEQEILSAAGAISAQRRLSRSPGSGRRQGWRAPRCKCGKYTLAMARHLGHTCPDTGPLTIDPQEEVVTAPLTFSERQSKRMLVE
jgi:hypothetical protein